MKKILAIMALMVLGVSAYGQSYAIISYDATNEAAIVSAGATIVGVGIIDADDAYHPSGILDGSTNYIALSPSATPTVTTFYWTGNGTTSLADTNDWAMFDTSSGIFYKPATRLPNAADVAIFSSDYFVAGISADSSDAGYLIAHDVDVSAGNFGNANAIIKTSSSATIGLSAIFEGSSANNAGTVYNALFDNSSYNAGTVYNALFDNSSYNNGTVNYNALFANYSYNNGTVNYNALFANYSYNAGTVNNALFYNSSYNAGTVNNALFYNSSYNAGTVYNALFYNSSYNNGTVNYNALFANSSYNNGSVNYNALFANYSYNAGTVNNALFYNSSYNNGSVNYNALFDNSSYNNGSVNYNALFANSSFNAGTVSGNSFFDFSSYNNSDATVLGDAGFWQESYNTGTVSGTIVMPRPVGIWNGTNAYASGILDGSGAYADITNAYYTITGGEVKASTIGNFAGTENLLPEYLKAGAVVDDVIGTLSGSSKPGFGGGAFSQ